MCITVRKNCTWFVSPQTRLQPVCTPDTLLTVGALAATFILRMSVSNLAKTSRTKSVNSPPPTMPVTGRVLASCLPTSLQGRTWGWMLSPDYKRPLFSLFWIEHTSVGGRSNFSTYRIFVFFSRFFWLFDFLLSLQQTLTNSKWTSLVKWIEGIEDRRLPALRSLLGFGHWS